METTYKIKLRKILQRKGDFYTNNVDLKVHQIKLHSLLNLFYWFG